MADGHDVERPSEAVIKRAEEVEREIKQLLNERLGDLTAEEREEAGVMVISALLVSEWCSLLMRAGAEPNLVPGEVQHSICCAPWADSAAAELRERAARAEQSDHALQRHLISPS